MTERVAEHVLFIVEVFPGFVAVLTKKMVEAEFGVADNRIFTVAVFIKKSGQQKQSGDGASKSRAKRFVLKANGRAAYVAGASARLTRGTPGQLPSVSTKGSSIVPQNSSSGTANAHVKTPEVGWPKSLE